MIENIESIIKSFLLLNNAERCQVSYLIDIINTGTESEKNMVIASLGLNNHCVSSQSYIKVKNELKSVTLLQEDL